MLTKKYMDDEVTLCYVGSELPLPRKRLPPSQQLRRMRQTSQGKGRMAVLLKVKNAPVFGRIPLKKFLDP
jgi:hypothetical protein